jgi:hypothetical protein
MSTADFRRRERQERRRQRQEQERLERERRNAERERRRNPTSFPLPLPPAIPIPAPDHPLPSSVPPILIPGPAPNPNPIPIPDPAPIPVPPSAPNAPRTDPVPSTVPFPRPSSHIETIAPPEMTSSVPYITKTPVITSVSPSLPSSTAVTTPTIPSASPTNASAQALEQSQATPPLIIGLLVAVVIFAIVTIIGFLRYLRNKSSILKKRRDSIQALLEKESVSPTAYSNLFHQNSGLLVDRTTPRSTTPQQSMKSLPRIPSVMLQNMNNTIADLTLPMMPTRHFPHSGLAPHPHLSIATDENVHIQPLSRTLSASNIHGIHQVIVRQVSVSGTTNTDTIP